MAAFTKLDQFADHLKYKGFLKVALAKAKTTPLRFVYFEKYKFGEKIFPLLVADADPALLNELKKKAGNVTALGKCRINDDDELVFDTENGKLDRNKLKQYLATFPGVPHVSLTSSKDAAATAEAKPSAAPPKPAERVGASQAAAAAPQRAAAASGPAAAVVTAAFDKLVPLAKQASLDHPDQKAGLTEALGAAQRLIKSGALEEAQKAVAKATAMVESLKSVKRESAAAGDAKAAIAAWQSARNQATAPLKQLIAEIQEMADPEGDAAIKLVQEIQAKLNVTPGTQEQADVFERYLKNDSAITDVEAPNGLGVKINLRKPLLEALTKLKSQLPA